MYTQCIPWRRAFSYPLSVLLFAACLIGYETTALAQFTDLGLTVQPPSPPELTGATSVQGALEGGELVYGSLFAGDGYDEGMAFDESDDGSVVCLTGLTNSTFPLLPKIGPSYTLIGCYDTKTRLPNFVMSFGGDGDDQPSDLAIADDYVFVTGITSSTDLPVTDGAFQTELGGKTDCFVAGFNIADGMLEHATYFGGPETDGCNGLDVTYMPNGGAVFFTGTAFGPVPDGDGLSGDVQGDSDIFVGGFSLDLTSLLTVDLFGSEGQDTGVDIGAYPIMEGYPAPFGGSPGNIGIYTTGTVGGVGFPVTEDAAQSEFAGGIDGFVRVMEFDPAAGTGSNLYSTVLGGPEQDAPTKLIARSPLARPDYTYVGVAGWTQSPGLETRGRAFNDGTLDGFVRIINGPNDFAQVYVGPDATDYILPLGFDITPTGSLVVGGYASATTTGTAFIESLDLIGNRIDLLRGGTPGTGNDMDYNDIIALPFARVGFGKTYGLPPLTDDALQSELVVPPEMVMHKYHPNSCISQVINLSSEEIRLQAEFDLHPFVRLDGSLFSVNPFSASRQFEVPGGTPFVFNVNPGDPGGAAGSFGPNGEAPFKPFIYEGGGLLTPLPDPPDIRRFFSEGAPSDMPTVFFNHGVNDLQVFPVGDDPDPAPMVTIPGGSSAAGLVTPNREYEVRGTEGNDFVDPRRYFLGARLRFGAAEKRQDNHEKDEHYPLPYLTIFRQSDAASSNAAATVDVFIFGPEGDQRDTAVPVANEREGAIPDRMMLYAAYPNPFNPSTVVRYELDAPMSITLAVYDAMGRRVRTLMTGEQSGGAHTVSWDARNDAGIEVSSGQYLIRLEGESGVQTRRVTLQR